MIALAGGTVFSAVRASSLRVGVKFNDAELLGMPTIVVVGRGLADGVVEVKDRRTGERTDIALADVVAHLQGS